MHKFPRYREKTYGLLILAFSLFVAFHAANSMFPLDLGDSPFGIKILVILFIFCWYSGLLVCMLYGLRWTHTVEIDNQEIRVCLGGFVLRRIALEQVKTVGVSSQYSRHGISFMELVLSEQNVYELSEKGQKYLSKRRVRKWMSRAGVSDQGPNAAARAYLFESRKGILLRIEQTVESESILRLHLHSTCFLA